MKKYILGIFLVGLLSVSSFSFAQEEDVDPNPDTNQCVTITNNLRYKDKDINKNGEVSTLQDFLQSEGYLNSEPTGYFGVATLKAVKQFQKTIGLSPTGYVGALTRAKIKSMSCEGGDITPGNLYVSEVSGPRSLTAGETGTWTVKASDQSGGTLSYSVDWGDTKDVCKSTGSANCAMSVAPVQQEGTFTHSYSLPGTYNVNFTVRSDNGVRCITSPCYAGGTATRSIAVKVGGSVSKDIIDILSPNGGETWQRGKIQTIKWQDKETLACKLDEVCANTRTYDIYLSPDSLCNKSGLNEVACAAVYLRYKIAENISGSSFDWTVGNTVASANDANIISDGAYKVQVCRSGTSACGSSDSYFKIFTLNDSSVAPVVSGVSGPQILNVGQSGTWTVKAYDPSGGILYYSVDWGDTNRYCPSGGGPCSLNSIGVKQEVQQSATFSHSYSQAGIYSPMFTITNASGLSATTGLSVKVGDAVVVNDPTPRVMYWWGKVNQHVDANGKWLTDPDGVSGANLDKLSYCQKWFPNTTSAEDYKLETTDTWRNRGNVDGPFASIKMSTKCVQK